MSYANSCNNKSAHIERIARATDPLSPINKSTTQFLSKFPVFYTAEDEIRHLEHRALPSDMSICDTVPTLVVRSDSADANKRSTASYSSVQLYFTEDSECAITMSQSCNEAAVDTQCPTIRT